MRVAALTLLLACFPASAADPWAKGEIAAEIAFSALVAVDIAQTRYGQDHGGVEHNPFLGSHPGPARVYLSALASLGLHVAVAHLLPTDWRRGWQSITFVLEAGNVAANYTVAGGARFSW